MSGVFDYAGPNRSSRYRACSYCLPHITRASASGLTVYGAEYPPRLSSVYASLGTSRYPAQDSRPSGSLLLSRKALSSFTPCRFSPAHCKRLLTSTDNLREFDSGNMGRSLSVRIASAKRRLRRMEEDRPLFLKRLAAQTEAERQLAIRVFEETLRKTKQELDDLAGRE